MTCSHFFWSNVPNLVDLRTIFPKIKGPSPRFKKVRKSLIFTSLCCICLPATADLSTCLPIPLYLPSDWLSATDLSTYLVISMQYLSTAGLPAVYLSFYSFVAANCQLPPMFSCLLTTADLSTIYLSSYSFASAYLSTYVDWLPVYCQPVYSRSVLLLYFICQEPTCQLSTYFFLFANCLPPICLPMTTADLSAADLSTADLFTYVHLYAVWSRKLIY